MQTANNKTVCRMRAVWPACSISQQQYSVSAHADCNAAKDDSDITEDDDEDDEEEQDKEGEEGLDIRTAAEDDDDDAVAAVAAAHKESEVGGGGNDSKACRIPTRTAVTQPQIEETSKTGKWSIGSIMRLPKETEEPRRQEQRKTHANACMYKPSRAVTTSVWKRRRGA